MNYISLKKEKNSTASKASETLKEDIKVHKGNVNQNKMNKKRINKKSKLPHGSGVIYIGHIPHGFYEDEMKSYFSQFGQVTETALARSKKTGLSKGYGFVEFKDKEVAKIAAETMNNYLMFNRIIKCRYIPPEERNIRVRRGTITATNYPRQKHRLITLSNNKKAFASLDQTAYLKKVQDKVNQFKRFFEKNGVDFTYKFDNEEKPEVQESTPETKKIKKAAINLEPEIKEEVEDQLGVLEIDESENEISFQTPPQVKKVIKKSVNSPAKPSKKSALSKNIQTKKQIKMNQLKNKKSKKVQEEKAIKKSEPKLNSTREKSGKKIKTNVKVAQPVMTKRSSKKETNAVIKQKNLKTNKSVGVKESRKGHVEQLQTIKDKKAKKKIKAMIKSS